MSEPRTAEQQMRFWRAWGTLMTVVACVLFSVHEYGRHDDRPCTNVDAPVLDSSPFALACAPPGLGTDGESQAEQSGSVPMRDPDTGKEIRVDWTFLRDPDRGLQRIRLSANNGSTEDVLTLSLEEGQEFFSHVGRQRFGERGDFLLLHTARGAVCQGLRIYAISRDGTLNEVFSDATRFGFSLVDVSGDGVPEVVAGCGDVSKKTMRVYHLTEGGFVEVERHDVTAPHVYKIVE